MFQTIDWHDLLDTGMGSKYWRETQAVNVIRVARHAYPPTVLNGTAPQEIFNKEAVQHIDPNADGANTLEVGIGIEEPSVPTVDEAWLDSSTHDTSSREPKFQSRGRFLQYSPSPEDHMSTFIPNGPDPGAPSPTRFWNPQLERAVVDSRNWNSSDAAGSNDGGAGSVTRSSDLSTMTTPRYQVDAMTDSPLQGYSVKTVVVLVKDSYTQVSAECQDSGFGRFGMPYELSKVSKLKSNIIVNHAQILI